MCDRPFVLLYADPREVPILASPAFRALTRVSIGTLVVSAALLVAALGWERARFGATDEEGLLKLQQLARDHVERSSAVLERICSSLAARQDLLAAAVTDHDGATALFEAAEAATVGEAQPLLSVSIYDPTGKPVAWSGRPSELPAERISGPADEFVSAELLGLRLVRIEPVFEGSPSGPRLATIAAEQVISARSRVVDPAAGQFTLAVGAAPVTLRPAETSSPSGDAFEIRSVSGELLLEAQVSAATIAGARATWHSQVRGALLLVMAAALALLVPPALEWRARTCSCRWFAAGTLAALLLLWASWALAWSGLAEPWGLEPVLSADAGNYTLVRAVFRTSPDFLLNGLLALSTTAVLFDVSERSRRALRRRKPAFATWANSTRFTLRQSLAAAAVIALIAGYQLVLRHTFNAGSLAMLHPSVYPWDVPRVVLGAGFLAFHASLFWLSVVILRVAALGWRLPHDTRSAAFLWAAWLMPLGVAYGLGRAFEWPVLWQQAATLFAGILVVTFVLSQLTARYRHQSQGVRIVVLLLALTGPALVTYPTIARVEDIATRRLVETEHGAQVLNQLEDLQLRVLRSREQIDSQIALADLLLGADQAFNGTTPPVDAAFRVWAQTDLAAYRLASAVELYDAEGAMVSRFAFNLPEYASRQQTWRSSGCTWDSFGEAWSFGAEERRLLHADRGICVPASPASASAVPGTAGVGGTAGQRQAASPAQAPGQRPAPEQRMAGSIVIHVLPDYEALPFIASRSPYVHLFGQPDTRRDPHRDVQFMMYGWGRVPLFSTGRAAWPLSDEVFQRAYSSRAPFWTTLTAGGTHYEVYVLNDRAGIYTLGYASLDSLDHLVHLAELATLGGLLFAVLLTGVGLAASATGYRAASARALLLEVRQSFYRKLFLAFVAVSIVPVLTLALVARAYMTGRLLDDAEADARRVAAVAQRVIEDYRAAIEAGAVPGARTASAVAVGRRGPGTGVLSSLYDDVMIWLSRVIDQDVNIYDTARLVATSERDLFASGFLPTRAPADVYRAIVLRRLPAFVSEERIGDATFLLAATPAGPGDHDGILTVPLTLRQQEIEQNVADLNRRIVLAALLFILFGALIGYVMAERIGDPVNRLTRATIRIARGELDARIASTSSDELKRLVEAFNRMAAELQRQRTELERTHRLEAWAEMARQVAHDIKNPLTPIQLSAEHLRRVHNDRGQPLSPVLDECVTSILSQVRMLRQIAGEFSSFAVAPVPRPSPTSVADLVEEVLRPYRSGIEGSIEIVVDVPPTLPEPAIDRTLVGRALTNMVDNALHAMPGGGILSITAREETVGDSKVVAISLADTGMGIDEAALRHLFEPYFSTKAAGTGLGLAIAKRNIEINGGTITIDSVKDRGTTVTVRLPLRPFAHGGA
ncbi:MAG: ATP-binding protein [Vicinamibacterales bacterium]